MAVSGWVHRQQLLVIEFLQAENRMLKERLPGKRIRFTDAERALLARKAKAVGRKALLELDTIVSPGHPRYLDAVAPPPGGGEVELQQAASPGATGNHARDLAADRADGTGESELGLHAD